MQLTYFLSKGIKLKPDIIILNYFINDAEQTPVSKENFFNSFSYAVVFLTSRIDSAHRYFFGGPDWRQYYADLYTTKKYGWKTTIKAINTLKKYCDTEGIKLYFFNYPEFHVLDNYPFIEINQMIRETVIKAKIDYYDLLPSLRKYNPENLWVSIDDAHPNKLAHSIIGLEIFNNLKEDFFDQDK